MLLIYISCETFPHPYTRKRRFFSAQEISVVANLIDYRLKRKSDSLRAWWNLAGFFGRCSVPIVMCSRLMFVSLVTYQTWARNSAIPKEHITLSEKYIRLYHILFRVFQTDENVSRWFLREIYDLPFKGRSPAQTIIEGGEPTLDNILTIVTSFLPKD